MFGGIPSKIIALARKVPPVLPDLRTLFAWGLGTSGQLGDGGVTTRSSPVQVGTSSDWNKVYGGRYFVTARKTNNTIWSWGQNSFGQLGHGNVTGLSSPVQIGTGADWSVVSPGREHVVAIKSGGTMWSWGRNLSGRLGLNDTTYRSSPVQIGSSTDWATCSAGYTHSHAIKTTGTLWSWGAAANGRLGNSTTNPARSSPVQVGTDTNWSKVSAGNASGIAIKTTGSIWSWGSSTYGQGGRGSTTQATAPQQIGSGTDWSKVSHKYHTMAIKTGGTLWAWGRNYYGELGLGYGTSNTSSPVQVGSDTTWSKISLSRTSFGGRAHAMAIKTDGTLWASGQNTYGQLGLGDVSNRVSPVQVGASTDWADVEAGMNFTIARKTDNSIWSWGRNNNGQLGQRDVTNRSSPVQIGTGTDWATIAAGNTHVVAIKTTGTMWSWGNGTSGRLGRGNSTSYSSPVQIGSATDWSKVRAGYGHSHAIKTTGTLWGWGQNGGAGPGRLGDNSTSIRYAPTQIGADTNWAEVDSGQYTTSMIRTTGTLWGCGRANYGQIGDGQASTNRSSPVQCGSDTNWSKVYRGYDSALAIKTTGSIWAWGNNSRGQLGTNNVTSRSTPTQIGSGTDWSRIRAGYRGGAAVKTGGSLWGWGLGGTQPTATGIGVFFTTPKFNISSPVQVGTDTNWSQVYVGQRHTIALKSNGTLWAWGRNNSGPLGQNDTVNRSSPVQIGTNTDWGDIGAHYFGGMAIKVVDQ